MFESARDLFIFLFLPSIVGDGVRASLVRNTFHEIVFVVHAPRCMLGCFRQKVRKKSISKFVGVQYFFKLSNLCRRSIFRVG